MHLIKVYSYVVVFCNWCKQSTTAITTKILMIIVWVNIRGGLVAENDNRWW